jgi:hypothetical protein
MIGFKCIKVSKQSTPEWLAWYPVYGGEQVYSTGTAETLTVLHVSTDPINKKNNKTCRNTL